MRPRQPAPGVYHPCQGFGRIIWPEGRPEFARYVEGFWARHWLLLGHGFVWSLRGRRMSECWPCSPSESPLVVARTCERKRRS